MQSNALTIENEEKEKEEEEEENCCTQDTTGGYKRKRRRKRHSWKTLVLEECRCSAVGWASNWRALLRGAINAPPQKCKTRALIWFSVALSLHTLALPPPPPLLHLFIYSLLPHFFLSFFFFYVYKWERVRARDVAWAVERATVVVVVILKCKKRKKKKNKKTLAHNSSLDRYILKLFWIYSFWSAAKINKRRRHQSRPFCYFLVFPLCALANNKDRPQDSLGPFF